MLISLLVAVIIFGILYYIINSLPIDPPFKTAAILIFLLIAVLYFVQYLPGGPDLVH